MVLIDHSPIVEHTLHSSGNVEVEAGVRQGVICTTDYDHIDIDFTHRLSVNFILL